MHAKCMPMHVHDNFYDSALNLSGILEVKTVKKSPSSPFLWSTFQNQPRYESETSIYQFFGAVLHILIYKQAKTSIFFKKALANVLQLDASQRYRGASYGSYLLKAVVSYNSGHIWVLCYISWDSFTFRPNESGFNEFILPPWHVDWKKVEVCFRPFFVF